MWRVIVAENDANEKALRLAEPLPGVSDHQKVRVSIESDDDPLARLASLNAPTADIDEMLSEIEAGRR